MLISPKYPNGVVVPLNKNLDTTAVRWRSWNTAEWNAGSAGTVDLVPGRENAPLEHMATYPASVLKLMVGFAVLRLVDRGDISLEDTVAYQPVDTSCGAAATSTIREWFDRMQTVSENRATGALIMMLYQRPGVIDETNQLFRDLGLPTLRLVAARGTETGGGWINTMKMTSMETAKLLLVVNGSPGVLWRTPAGEPVTRDARAQVTFAHKTGLSDHGGVDVVVNSNLGARYTDANRPADPPGVYAATGR